MYQKLLAKTKLNHHQHTGKIVHNQHTMYSMLILMLLMVGAVLLVATSGAMALDQVQSGSVQVSGVVQGEPPTQAAIISSPIDGQRYKTRFITISGKCMFGMFVEVYSNGAFLGAVECKDGTYRLGVSLFPGANQLLAKNRDSLNQSGPDSDVVTAYYDEPIELASSGSTDLFLRVDSVYRGIFPGQSLKLRPELTGGTGPWSLDIDWQDGEGFHADLPIEGEVLAAHTYTKPGNYRIVMSAADSHGKSFRVSTMVVVNGHIDASTTGSGQLPLIGGLRSALSQTWTLFAVSAFMLGSFWVGQQLTYARLIKQIQTTRQH